MMNTNIEPKTLLEAVKFFSDYENCRSFMVEARWPDGKVKCPLCGSEHVKYMTKTRRWKCYGKHARPQFTLKVGTIFEDSPIGLDKWLCAMFLVANCKNGVSSYEVARDLHVTQKSAWFMLQRIRHAMHTGTFKKLSGQIEADETFIGGKARNMHKAKRERVITGTGGKDKTIVMGVLERGGEVRATVVPTRRKNPVQSHIREHVLAGSAIFTDALKSYEGLTEFQNDVIDHAVAYVDGEVHTTAWRISGAC